MFWRGVWGYLPANIVQGAVGFLAIMLFMGVLNPIKKWVVYLRSPAVERNRRRAVGVSLLLALSPFVLLGAIPWTDSIRAPGLVESVESTRVSSQATTPAARSTAMARRVMSPRLPIGVATIYSPGSGMFAGMDGSSTVIELSMEHD